MIKNSTYYRYYLLAIFGTSVAFRLRLYGSGLG